MQISPMWHKYRQCILIYEGFKLDFNVAGLSPWWLAAAAHPWVEEEVDVLVQEGLVLLVSSTEVLQKLVGQLHDVLHAQVFPLKEESTVVLCARLPL